MSLKRTFSLFIKDVKIVTRDVLAILVIIYDMLAPTVKSLLSKAFSFLGTSVAMVLTLLVGE